VQVTLQLTAAGCDACWGGSKDQVTLAPAAVVLDYVAFLRQAGPHERTWRELQAAAALDFR
jgi:hypothetical protein